mgnify:CR=1 FL=1
MNKIELIAYINENTTRKISGRKELTLNDIFISGNVAGSGFRVSAFGRDVISRHFKAIKAMANTDISVSFRKLFRAKT